MDSSPDLSLKLRRGSSDSRDNFYMDFAQGIDSDIEEVDNSGVVRGMEQQQPPEPQQLLQQPPLPMVADIIPPPPLSLQQQPLPTLPEADDLPPTPPPQHSSTEMSSPPVSPTTSVLEMIPPPPLSPPLSAAALRRLARPPSPPIETEDEGDDADVEEPTDVEDDDDDKPTPPPPLAPLPLNYSYMHGASGRGVLPAAPVSPPLTKSPSTSPSPPNTPPPCPKLKMVSPPPPAHTAPLTPPSESDQSQPGSPPPLPPHHVHLDIDASPPQPASPKEELVLSTPPPEFGQADDMIAAVLAASVEAASQDLIQDVLQGAAHQIGTEDPRSLHDDESTTITTPPSNGYSASSIIAPPAEHLGELEPDVVLADIPPPPGMEDDEDQDEEPSGERTPISEQQQEEVITEEHTTEDTPADEVVDEQGTPTPQATPTTSGSPRKRSAAGSRGPSRSASRSGSHTDSRTGSRSGSRSGSVRGSLGSRQASVASAGGSVASQSLPIGVTSPQASIKSIKSQLSVRSLSKQSPISAAAAARMQSPPEGDSPPAMPSPPQMRSPPVVKSPPVMHSPPKVTSPPRVYSPPLVSSPPESDKPEVPIKSTGTDSLPSSATSASTAPATTRGETIAAATAMAAASTSLSYQDENITRPQISSHYQLPHQFQHPHHQNHHPHMHTGVPVPTPTVPVGYAGAHLLQDVRHIKAVSIGGGGGHDDDSSAGGGGGPPGRRTPPQGAPSPNLLHTTETVSHSSISPAKSTSRLRDSSSHHRVTIDESNLPLASSLTEATCGGGGGDGDGSGPPTPSSASQQQLTSVGTERQTGHLALMYHSHQLTNYPMLPAIKRHRPSFVYPPMPRVKSGDALATLFSALYGKLLVVMGIAFPMAEVISTYIPPSFYEVYYLYLYIGSMIFLLFMYATLLWGKPKIPKPIVSPTKSTLKPPRSTSASESMEESDTDSTSTRNKHIPPVIPARRPSLLSPLGRQHHYGSFYLRMGAVAFGIGSMIYSGLEFGQYFELNPDTKCHNVLLALTPATRMAFIFIQMYFIFLNNEQIKVYRYKIIARFGLMHMIGTNLAVWLNVLIQETKHEILTFYNPENRTLRISHRIPGHARGNHPLITLDPTAHLRVPRGLKGPYQIFECRRTNIIGTLVQDASPFLFPCTIEYSLICAAILYVMWRSISRPQQPTPQRPDTISSPMKRSPHHYSVDCARAHKGLFVGILILVLTIISLILFFVLISRPDFVALAVTEVTICELLIYGTTSIATLIGMIQMRHLQYDTYRSFSLDDILLVGAQTGSFLYNIFTVIAGQFSLRSDDMLVPINALASIVQTACQTMFILDASRRQAITPEHLRKKPGREIVTFMLVANLAMWAISTLEKSRAESHPIQLNFYGLWAWTIITHVSMPLAIFYRFHSTVCLCEIWKRAYKLKPTYM